MAEENAQQKLVQQQSELKAFGGDGVPCDENGWPLARISCGAAELVPTKQFSNVTVGPIIVRRYVKDGGDDEQLLEQIHRTQKLCERAVAEDRETVHNMIRQSEQGRLIP